MPIVPVMPMPQAFGKVASPLFTDRFALPVPIVPINPLLKAVAISNKEVIGTDRRLYARKEFETLGHRLRHKEVSYA